MALSTRRLQRLGIKYTSMKKNRNFLKGKLKSAKGSLCGFFEGKKTMMKKLFSIYLNNINKHQPIEFPQILPMGFELQTILYLYYSELL